MLINYYVVTTGIYWYPTGKCLHNVEQSKKTEVCKKKGGDFSVYLEIS